MQKPGNPIFSAARLHDIPGWLRTGFTVVYLMGVTWVSLSTSLTFPSTLSFSASDKIFHLLVYGILGGLMRWVFWGHLMGAVRSLSILAAVCGYGVIMEIAQEMFTKGMRQFDPLDIAANSLGAVLFWVFTGFVLNRSAR